jgi:acyl dehydratase
MPMRFERRVTGSHVAAMAEVFGDVNPLHDDPAAARAAGFERPIAHGAVLVGLLSEIIGCRLGTTTPIFCDLQISFVQPFYEGDLLRFELKPRHRSAALGATAFAFSVLRTEEPIARGEFLVKEPVRASTRRGTAA